MKVFSYWLVSISVLCTFASCEHNVSMETVVHEDGSLDRTIILDKSDSVHIDRNVFGINEKSGWSVKTDKMISAKDDDKLVITFSKHFDSVEEANDEMNSEYDTLFRVKSTFEKKFRWFYTYLRYSDTYGAINRFSHLSPSEYFTVEDYAFIDRLPAEGSRISNADSLFLHRLNEKIFDHYAPRAFFEEFYLALAEIMKNYRLEQYWLDTLAAHKERIYNTAVTKEGAEDDFVLKYADSLGIPFPQPQVANDFKEVVTELETRANFMSYANDGKYFHSIRMPWPVIRSNSDSLSGTQLFWRPPVTKFLLKDHEMFAESRKINLWAVILSAVIVMITVYLLVRKKS